MENIVVRKAVPADYPYLKKLAAQLRPQGETSMVKEQFKAILKKRDHCIYVALLAGQVVGWLHGCLVHYLHKETVSEICGLVVDENYRKLGIGRNLINACEKWSHKKGVQRIMLLSNARRQKAHGYYNHLNFVLEKISHVYMREIEEKHI